MTKLEKIWTIVVLCLAAGVRLSSFDEGDTVVLTGVFDLMGLLTQLLQYGLLAYLVYFHWSALRQNLRYLLGPMPLALLVLASTLWSVVPSFTLRRAIALVLISLLAYCIGALLDPAELSQIYVRALRAMVILSVFVIVFLRQYGISHGAHAGAWRGAFYHKNRAGEIMALAFVTFAVVTPMSLSRLHRWGIAAVALVLLYKSQASTAVVAVAVVLGAQAVWRLLMVRRKALIGVLLTGYPFVALAAISIPAYSSSILKLLGKDATLSGRDRLWSGVLDAINMRPLLGYGYLAFWLEQGGQRTTIQEKTSFITIHAHNGFLNLMLHVGIVGLVLFLVFLAHIMWLTIREGRRTRGIEARWFYSFLVLVFVANLTESQILESPLVWVTLITFYTSLSIQRANRYDEFGLLEQAPTNPAQLALGSLTPS